MSGAYRVARDSWADLLGRGHVTSCFVCESPIDASMRWELCRKPDAALHPVHEACVLEVDQEEDTQ